MAERPSGDANVTPNPDPTQPGCAACHGPLPAGRPRSYCSARCRQTGYRRRHTPPGPAAQLPPARSRRDGTLYACPECDTRYLAEQWCPDCQRPCRRLGPGGPCPHCDELIAHTELSEVIITG